MMPHHVRDRAGEVRQANSASGNHQATPKRYWSRHRALAVGFSAIVFAGSVGYIGRTFRWGELWLTLKDVNLICLMVGGGGSIIAYWMLRTLRWHVLLRRTDTHVPLLDLYMCTAVSLSFALFTPLQSGEVLKIELLRRYGMIRRSPGYGSFLVERALDLAALLTMACVSLLTTINILPTHTHVWCVIGGLVVVCAVALIVLQKLHLTGWPLHLMEHMRRCVGDVATLLLVIVITCVSWASVVTSWQVFLYSGGISVGFVHAVAMVSLVALISILSLIPGGLGISEVGTSQLLVHFGVAAATAQAGSLVLRSYSLVAIALGVGHLGFWKLVRARRRRLPTEPAVLEPVTTDADTLIM